MMADTAAEMREISFDQTVPRQLAHRRAVAEVFVTDSVQVQDGEFLVGIQLPRAHSLWGDRNVDYHDPLAAVEAGRQGTFVIVHRHLGVPSAGLPFISRQIEFHVEDLEALRDDGAPLEGIFHVRLKDLQERDGQLSGASFHATLTAASRQAMTMSGELIFLPMPEYRLLRAHGRARHPAADPGGPAATRLEPAAVGRRDPRNVVLTAGDGAGEDVGYRFGIVADVTHPAFFDHPQDHLPGPLLVEAIRQAAVVAADDVAAISPPCAVATAGHATFLDFVELDSPRLCGVGVPRRAAGERVAVDIAVVQSDRRLVEATVELAGVAEPAKTTPGALA